ncbi:MAG TPA: hypothetical protein VFC18_22805 [Burkholderiales bacterium]|nr:hypothetical protein [Burkholderiales bacterium]
MDDRGYVAQAFFDRVRSEGIALQVLGDARLYPESAPPEADIAVARSAFGAMPRLAARFCQEYDLQLVRLGRPALDAWRFVLSWTDDVGRPGFLAIRVVRQEELLAGTAPALFEHGLLDALERPQLLGDWITALWERDAVGAEQRLARHWASTADRQLVSHAVRMGEWSGLRAAAPRLRRARRRSLRERLLGVAAAACRLVEARAPTVSFTGREGSVRSSIMVHVARDLAPLGLRFREERPGERRRRSDFRVVFDPRGELPAGLEDAVALHAGQPLGALVAEAERAILRWLECRVERRYPDAVVGENPLAARILQLAVRKNLPFKKLLFLVLNSDISCAIRSPILMPYPYGIVIEEGALIGSRVMVMQQASLHGSPVIEDNVCIGPGARIAGALRIGRGATVGANAVVTRDVPSHCTVVGANRILGPEPAAVAAQRLAETKSVVNM